MPNLKRFISIIISAAIIFTFSGCFSGGNKDEAPVQTPVSTPDLSEPVNIESPIVGQWIPVGFENEGYMQFYADGTAVKFVQNNNGEPKIYEQKYYLPSENTFKFVYKDGNESDEYRFEVINDGKTLNIYETTNSLNMASEFYRIDWYKSGKNRSY